MKKVKLVSAAIVFLFTLNAAAEGDEHNNKSFGSKSEISQDVEEDENAEEKLRLVTLFAETRAAYNEALIKMSLWVGLKMKVPEAEKMLGRSLTRIERTSIAVGVKDITAENFGSLRSMKQPYWHRVIAGRMLSAYNFRIAQPLPPTAPPETVKFRDLAVQLRNEFGVNSISEDAVRDAAMRLDGNSQEDIREARKLAQAERNRREREENRDDNDD